ncbi:MAG TPA: hypothetical protein EYG92_11050 [Lutibacter sp.]|nr:hypothetical protein [Lutibacter sp.]
MNKIFKTVKQLILYSLLFIILVPISCIIKPQTRLQAYYEFQEEDLAKIMDFELHQELIYRNSQNETIIFEVEKVNDDYKKQVINGGGSFFGIPQPYSYHFYFDEQISMIRSNTKFFYMGFKFRRFPSDIQNATINDYTELSSEFIGYCYFYNWNGVEEWNAFGTGGSGAIAIDYDSSTIVMTCNGKTYENIYVIASGNSEPEIHGVITRKVNVIYYDLYNGIIGFDDTDGKEWRLSN